MQDLQNNEINKWSTNNGITL